MSNNLWEKFDSMINVEALKSEVAAAQTGNKDFKKVPHGTYNVKAEKIELKESKSGKPMLSIWFKIIDGEFENSILFYNQSISAGFGLSLANETLRSLDTGVTVKFENFKQYNELLETVFTGTAMLEYEISYSENDKGYDTYKVEDVLEVS